MNQSGIMQAHYIKPFFLLEVGDELFSRQTQLSSAEQSGASHSFHLRSTAEIGSKIS